MTFVILAALFSHSASAQEATQSIAPFPATGKPRPRIGLVLSGGGARGYAHLGVLKVLEELHVPVDYIAGTSMGAVVGGLYASGLSANNLETKLNKTNLSDIAFDRNERQQLTESQREDNYQYPIGLNAGYGDGKLKIPAGLVQGNRLLALMQNWTPQLPGNINFDDLPIPFRAVATDLGTGEEVVLTHGSLPRAIRSSMAVPGLFAPYELDGRTLVDGGLVSNLPVQQARDMGADIIIAVNISTPLEDAANLESATSVAQQMITILLRQNVKAQLALLKPDDVLIEPDLGDISVTDFARGKDGVAAGEKAAQQMTEKLRAFSLSPDQWQAYLKAKQPTRLAGKLLTAETRIDTIDITAKGRVPARVVQQQLDVHVGDRYDVDTLNQDLARLSTNGDFKSVTQELVSENGNNILKVNAEEKSWGPQFLLFGFGMSSGFDAHGDFNLQVGHRFPWITASGLEWRNDVILGTSQIKLHSELRQPIWDTVGVYLAPYVEYGRRRSDIYLDDSSPGADTLPITAYQLDTSIVGADIGVPIGRLGEFRAGINYRWFHGSPAYNVSYLQLEDSGNVRINQATAHAAITIDQLDDPLFPRKGYYLYANTDLALSKTDNPYNQVSVKGLWATSYGSHTFNIALEGSGVYGESGSNPNSFGTDGLGFTLGGFQHLSAYATNQFTGDYLLYARMTYLNNLRKFTLPGFTSTVLGSSLEIGDTWIERNDFGHGPYKKSVSLFLGGNSLIGPLYFGFAMAPQGVWNAYLQLGRVF
ncbi:patatin-like phospholipase family protein [Glaciimonas soli]|uniref:BamA/TamA family outer membrane protein n=1 Tax=Glaciimonas soli TaxID=2590999 RepID=A0A843YUH6_9BURK|nr:patatin-like phospholipase family protein [Glaciimonas soli]MQR01283.1 BamA/TamA family outer membrane protein [Glaciimonas soli]